MKKKIFGKVLLKSIKDFVMTENERFKCLVDYLKENRYIRNQQQFVEDVKSDKTTISQLLNGRISAPKILFGNVCAAYPFVSLEWLRDGVGDMLKVSEQSMTRPHVDLYAAGGGNEVLDGVTLAQCEQVPVMPMLPRYDFTMRVTGESMQPQIRPGDVVACMRIDEPTFLQWDRKQGLFLVGILPTFLLGAMAARF